MKRTALRGLALGTAVVAAVLLPAAPALAHPLGNFTVNTYSAVVVEPSVVRVDVVVDRAEIPTRQVFPRLDDRTGTLPGEEAAQAATSQCDAVADGAELTRDGRPTALRVDATELSFPEGAAGLRTARLVCSLTTGEVDGLVGSRLSYELTPPSRAAGWHETSAVGDGTRLRGADVPEQSVSDALRAYPEDLLSSPLDVRSASFEVAAGSGQAEGVGGLLTAGAGSALPRGADRLTEAFTSLVSRERLDAPFVLGALGIALLLGGAHAFAPGHGKTVMAAYLVGQRGAFRDAALIGASVTVTHTLGVLVLGIALSAAGLATPERLYPWLGLASGLLLVGIGAALLYARRRTRLEADTHAHPPDTAAALTSRTSAHPVPALVRAGSVPPALSATPEGDHDSVDHPHDHDHPHVSDHPHDRNHPHDGDHDHDAHPHPHGHDGGEHSHGLFKHSHAVAPQGSGVRGLLAVGFAGGLVPSPSALIVLLGGIALGRAWFGLVLVIAYGLGMASALVLVGFALVKARDRVSAALRRTERPRQVAGALALARALPVVTAVLVIVVGLGVSARAVLQL